MQGLGTSRLKPHAVKGQWNVKQEKAVVQTGSKLGCVLWSNYNPEEEAAHTVASLSVRCSYRAEFKYWVAPLCGPQLRVQRFQIGYSASTTKLQ